MTLEQIQAEVRLRLGGVRRSDLLSSDGLTALNNWIDFAYRELAHTFRFPAFERLDSTMTTSVSNAYTTIPANVYAVLTIYDTTNTRYIDPLPGGWDEYERRGILSATAGKPLRWTRLGNLAYFDPRPDGVYSLRAFVIDEPSVLSAGIEPSVPEIWHKSIVYRATAEGWSALGEPTRAAAAMREYASHLATIRPQRGIESYTRRTRGVRVRTGASHRKLGV